MSDIPWAMLVLGFLIMAIPAGSLLFALMSYASALDRWEEDIERRKRERACGHSKLNEI